MTKYIGVISITVIGATICLRELDKRINEESIDVGYKLISCPLHEIIRTVSNESWEELAELVISAGRALIDGGCELLIMPSNTPHIVFDVISSRLSDVDMLNLLEVVSDDCARSGFNRVCVLGTKQTMLNGIYDSYLHDKGVESVRVAERTIDKIDRLIKEDLVHGRENIELQREIESDLEQVQCDAFILGCTELPEIYTEALVGKPVVDTTRLLACVAVDKIKSELSSHNRPIV